MTLTFNLSDPLINGAVSRESEIMSESILHLALPRAIKKIHFKPDQGLQINFRAHPRQNTESKGPGVKGHALSYRNYAISQQAAAELTCHLSIYIESPGLHWDSLWSLMGTDEGQEAALCHKAVMMMTMVAW